MEEFLLVLKSNVFLKYIIGKMKSYETNENFMRVLIIIILIVIVNTANCQDEKKKDFFIDELYISYNRSVNVNTVSKDGFGIGLKIALVKD